MVLHVCKMIFQSYTANNFHIADPPPHHTHTSPYNHTHTTLSYILLLFFFLKKVGSKKKKKVRGIGRSGALWEG